MSKEKKYMFEWKVMEREFFLFFLFLYTVILYGFFSAQTYVIIYLILLKLQNAVCNWQNFLQLPPI